VIFTVTSDCGGGIVCVAFLLFKSAAKYLCIEAVEFFLHSVYSSLCLFEVQMYLVVVNHFESNWDII
jgi:hypothetical protein